MGFRLLSKLVLICLLLANTSLGWATESVDFNRDVRPILAAKCFSCHGPDEESREAELRFDVGEGESSPFADRGDYQVIKPGDVVASEMWRRVTTDDESEQMPPPDAKIPPLTDLQRQTLRQWIASGARYDAFWAFEAPSSVPLPASKDSLWSRNRIDRFVSAKLEREGAPPRPTADRRALIRRVTMDLTGLPPTIEEIRAYLSDQRPLAYERLVDRLIDSPRYGEHMAKYWLDLVRFADTNGIHHDHYREMTPYRDWVIRSFNQNLPFDKFVVDQVAGDLHAEPTVDELIASGFNRLHLVIDRGTAIPEESFVRNVIDRVTAFGTAFMGLTVGCAVCHDHKYDPVTQRDFYQLFAFFNNIDSGPETPGRGLHAPFLRLPNPDQQARLDDLEAQIASWSEEAKQSKADLETAKATESGRVAAEDRWKAAQVKLKEFNRAKGDLLALIPVSLVMKERAEPRPTHILIRGAYDQPGELVQRATPSFLPPLQSASAVPSRMDLARWLVNPRHPLMARVTVNRLWQQFFGVGLVKTSEDFGTQGEWPSHPKLLDHLAVSFVESGWDVKRLVRDMVSSQTYRQSSHVTAEQFAADAENRLLARGSRFRLDAEMIRDQILFVSGGLNHTMFGKSVKPPQPPNLWKSVSMRSSSTYSFTADSGAKIHRRSLYSFWKRALPPPQMTIFDAPTRESCTARRERTNTPLQALVLMNEEQYFLAAKQLAAWLLEQHEWEDERRLTHLYERITSRLPDDLELERLQQGLQQFRDTYADEPQLAAELTDGFSVPDDQRANLAAYAMVVNALFNLDVTKTRE